MSKVAKTPPVLDKSIKMEDDYLKSRRDLGQARVHPDWLNLNAPDWLSPSAS